MLGAPSFLVSILGPLIHLLCFYHLTLFSIKKTQAMESIIRISNIIDIDNIDLSKLLYKTISMRE